MQKSEVRFASKGGPSLLVWKVGSEVSNNAQDLQAFVISLMSRSGGMLIAVPQQVISDGALLGAAFDDEDSFLGPSREFSVELVAESDEGQEIAVGSRQDFIVIDVMDQILAEKTSLGNILAHRSMQLMYIGAQNERQVSLRPLGRRS